MTVRQPTAVTEGAGAAEDARARRNAILLAIAYALYGASVTVLVATGALIGAMLASDRGLATLPITTFVAGTALTTVPASLLMRRIGRRAGFCLGAGLGLISALLAIVALVHASFPLFLFATFLTGSYQAFAQYYRFAAADTASPGFRGKAISWVLIGGTFSAALGPFIVIGTRDWLAPFAFAGCYATVAVLTLLALATLARLDIPRPPETAAAGEARPLRDILRQPRLLVAIACGMTAYGLMNFVMTASPLAMVDCGFTVDAAAWVIQWHALAMFVPSFFTGSLIARWGTERVMGAGMLLLAGAGVAGLAGLGFGHFAADLILLGLGWNFAFVGATTVVTGCYRPAEKNKVQALNDFAIFVTVALASLASGKLLSAVGWGAVNAVLLPSATFALGLLLWLVLARPQPRAA